MAYQPLTPEQFNAAKKSFSTEKIISMEQKRKQEQGGMVSQETPTPQDGFLKSLIKDPIKTLLVKPAIRTAEAVGSLGVRAFGGEEANRRLDEYSRQPHEYNVPILGKYNIEPVKPGFAATKQIAGETLKAGSYLYGGGTAGALTKPTLGTLVREGAKVGGAGGAMYGGGQALEEGKSLPTALGSAAVGGAVGAVAGATVPLAFAGVSKAIRATGRGAQYAASPRSAKVTEAVNDLEDTYLDINRGWVQTRKASEKASRVTEIKNRSGTTGRTPERVLAESGIIPEHEGMKFSTLTQAEKLREDVTPLARANKEALKEAQLSTVPLSVDELERNAIARARSPENIANGTADDLEAGLRKRYDSYRKNYGQTIPLETVDDIKSASWKKKGFSLTRDDKLATDIDYIIGKSAQESIEETAAKAGAIEVAQLNREIGDVLEAAKFLQNLDGRAVLYGKMGKHMLRLAGAIAGSKGGIIGSIAGIAGGEVVARMLASASIAGPIKRMILKDLEKTNPQAYIKTLNWLKKQGLDRELHPVYRLQVPHRTCF